MNIAGPKVNVFRWSDFPIVSELQRLSTTTPARNIGGCGVGREDKGWGGGLSLRRHGRPGFTPAASEAPKSHPDRQTFTEIDRVEYHHHTAHWDWPWAQVSFPINHESKRHSSPHQHTATDHEGRASGPNRHPAYGRD
ncbi:hypothetical protein BaRGS_00005258 [Batillaria attramentaria]|uniref:Uncharacterized protein n=1 Tax=Batillaria attramentaria TaxID=370345 RepID=A0ABD0LWI8_9CAEN